MAIKIPPPPTREHDFSNNWQLWLYRLREILGTISNFSWSLIDFTSSNITDIKTRNHNDLTSIQGGSTNERYHLTLSQYTNIGTTPDHNDTQNIQGGTTDEYYHLTLAEYSNLYGAGGTRWVAGVDTTDDLVIDDSTSGLVLKSPDGHYWRVQITNLGVLTVTDLGTTKP